MTPNSLNKNEKPESVESTEKVRRRFLTVWTWVGAIILVGVGVFLLNLLTIPVGIVLWTIVIVFILGGPVNFLEQRGVPRGLGTALAYVMLFAVLGVVSFLLFSPAVGINEQFNELIASLPLYVENLSVWANEFYLEHSDLLQNDQVQQGIASALGTLGQSAQEIATMSASGVVAVGASVVNSFVTVGFAVVVAFWMLMDLPKLKREMLRLVGEEHLESAQMLYLTFTRVVGGYLKAMIIQCVVIGLGCGILYFALATPSPAALGTITGLLNIIPIVGPWIGGAIVFIITVFVSPITAVLAIIGTILIQQVVYTFVMPRIMGDSVDIHPALTFLALMGGAAIGGAMSGLMGALVGSLLSIPAVACAKAIFVYYFEKNTGRRIVAEDGVFFKGVTPDNENAEVDPMADATAYAPIPATPAIALPPLLKDSSETQEQDSDDAKNS